jgi:hypothetical protein
MMSKARAVLKARRIVPDACLLWPQAKIHMSKEINGATTGYWRLGPESRQIFEAGPDAMGVIEGVAIWESREFDVNVGGPRAQPLERSTQVGEFYGMLFGSRRTEELCVSNGVSDLSTYRTSQRDIFIYDLPSDDYRRISFREALLETEIFQDTAPHAIRPCTAQRSHPLWTRTFFTGRSSHHLRVGARALALTRRQHTPPLHPAQSRPTVS